MKFYGFCAGLKIMKIDWREIKKAGNTQPFSKVIN